MDVSLKKGLWSILFLDTFVQEINNKLVQKTKIMKTVFITLISGFALIFLTSAVVENRDDFIKAHDLNMQVNYWNLDSEIDAHNFSNRLENLGANTIINIEKIKVYELEEEVKLGFDTEEFLPENFNPYGGLNAEEKQDFESRLMFTAVFGEVTDEEMVEIEDVIIYEIDNSL